MVADLENNILSGLILVVAVILLFIGGRSAIFVALAIPYSMLITFILLAAFDVTLNMVVLFSLILALGMLVDNGIVIVENIYRHIQEGMSRKEAALAGANQVAWPVITSTATTLGAFMPMLFWPGIMGEFMGYLPETLIMALTASLFVALVINPVLSARYQTVKPLKTDNQKTAREPLVKRVYLVLLNWSLNHRLIDGLHRFSASGGIHPAVRGFWKGSEFMPDTEPRRAYVHVKAPEGTNLDASDKLVQLVENIVSKYEDIRYVISNIGPKGAILFHRGGPGPISTG